MGNLGLLDEIRFAEGLAMASMRIRALFVRGIFCVLSSLLPFGFQACAEAVITDVKTGITGTTGNDIIHSTQPLDVNSILETTSDEDVTTAATGVDGLAGDDQITDLANITTTASSRIDVPYVPIRMAGTGSK